MNRKYARMGLMLFAMIFILVISLQDNNLIMAMVGLFGIPVLYIPYLIEDWYLPYRKKKKAEKAIEDFRAAANKQAQNIKQQPEKDKTPAREETAQKIKQQPEKDKTPAREETAVKAEKEVAVPEGAEEETACMLEDLRISDEVCMSEVFCFSDEEIEDIISDFFSGDMIRNIDGEILSREERLKAVRQIRGYGRQWDRGIKEGVNHVGHYCKPGSISHAFNIETVESFCLDGGNYMEDGDDRHVITLKFCFDAEADWDRDILPKWQRRRQIKRGLNMGGGSMIRDERISWGYNGKLENGMIEVRVADKDRLYLKNPFGMGGVFYYEYEHTVN